MATQLTESDLADHEIIFAEPHGKPRTVRAAYVDAEPDWLVFKDHQHRTIARVNRHLVVMVERK